MKKKKTKEQIEKERKGWITFRLVVYVFVWIALSAFASMGFLFIKVWQGGNVISSILIGFSLIAAIGYIAISNEVRLGEYDLRESKK